MQIVLAAFLLAFGFGANAQSSAAEGCNTVQVYPFPLNAERPLTAQVSRLCNTSAPSLAVIDAEVAGQLIRIETSCALSPLPAIRCQAGQAEIGTLDPGQYAIDVVDQATGNLLFSDSLTVGRVTSVPTLRGAGLAMAALLLLGVGLAALPGQPGRSRFSNRRS